MEELEYQFTLQDRVAKIQAINKQYDLEHNSYISYSGGLDSCVNSRLIDIALPNNNIPRVYCNTGIEYTLMMQFVKNQAKKDKRIIIINNTTNIPKMLKKEGYPFKSKQHSQNYGVYFRNKSEIQKELNKIEEQPKLKFDYDYIHNLSRGTKSIIKYVVGIREKDMPNNVVERERELSLRVYRLSLNV